MVGKITVVFSILLILLSVLPFFKHPHWIFRVPEFMKAQLLILQIVCFILSFFILGRSTGFWMLQCLQWGLIVYHIFLLVPYTFLYQRTHLKPSSQASKPIELLVCNVYQYNKEYHRLIDLIRVKRPHMLLTMESNVDWEKALQSLDLAYPYQVKVALENTYGMHLYSSLPIKKAYVHYFVADDVPSIEAHMQSEDGFEWVFFGVHPPPPSPTEESNAKERDGELLSVAKRVRKLNLPVLVSGDFNNVAWAPSSKLFRKTSRLIDARVGRGFLSTFHANYWIFRVPLDLVFHSPKILINRLSIQPSIGSDHFPITCEFKIDPMQIQQYEEVEDLDQDEMKEVNEQIAEGKQEESERRGNA
jgi:endonuclease/exonuclease/phosphatase (EEP) superfamily protein YafD